MHGRICTRMRASGGSRFVRRLSGLIALWLCALGWMAPLARGEIATFGKTSVGRYKDVFASDRKRVNEYTLPSAGAIDQLKVYLEPGTVSGQQSIEGVIYGDSSGAPEALLGVSSALTYA